MPKQLKFFYVVICFFSECRIYTLLCRIADCVCYLMLSEMSEERSGWGGIVQTPMEYPSSI